MIVDDFEADREAEIELIASISDLPISFGGQCENAIQAYDKIHEIEPDIVMCDVQMPYMDGLSFARKIANEFPDIQFIFCSLYDNFSYVKEAIQIQSAGYLLKPIDEKEFHECVARSINKIDERIFHDKELNALKVKFLENLDMVHNSFYHDLVFGLITDQSEIEEKLELLSLDFDQTITYLALVEVDDFLHTANRANVSRPLITMKVLHALRRFSSIQSQAYSVRLDDSHFAYIRSFPIDIKEPNSSLSVMRNDCQQFIRHLKADGVSVTIAMGNGITNLFQMNAIFEQCRHQLRFKYTLGSGRVISSNEVTNSSQHIVVDLNSYLREIRYIVSSNDDVPINVFVTNLFKSAYNSSQCQSIAYGLAMSINMVLHEYDLQPKVVLIEFDLWEQIQQFETVEKLIIWFSSILEKCRRLVYSIGQNKYLNLVENIKHFIDSSKLKELNLQTIASEFHYSPNHINTIFKQITGQTISDYVTEQKIKQAKVLLSDSTVRLYDVATQLGYSHAAHFNSVFKKNVGISPREYRDSKI